MPYPIRRAGALAGRPLFMTLVLVLVLVLVPMLMPTLMPSADAQETTQSSVITALPCFSLACLPKRAASGKDAPRPPLRIPRNDAARDWKDNMSRPARSGDDDGCLLSVTLGGDLDIRGYKGVRLFGAPRTLAPPAKEGR